MPPESPTATTHQTPGACALCGRSGLELTRHHLVPRSRHRKNRTKRLHAKHDMHHAIAWLCRPCHSTVHATLSEQELAEVYHSVDALKMHPAIAKFAKWVARRPADRRVPVRRPARR